MLSILPEDLFPRHFISVVILFFFSVFIHFLSVTSQSSSCLQWSIILYFQRAYEIECFQLAYHFLLQSHHSLSYKVLYFLFVFFKLSSDLSNPVSYFCHPNHILILIFTSCHFVNEIRVWCLFSHVAFGRYRNTMNKTNEVIFKSG